MRQYGEGVKEDALRLLCGEKIGSGSGRDVYVFEPDPAYVIKIEASAGCYQNILEWENWKLLKDGKFAKYFAPCKLISPFGCALVMRKTERLPVSVKFRAPRFLRDVKGENFGMIGKDVVCHDYAHLAFRVNDRIIPIELSRIE
ncbi:hypothetical protein [Ferrovibrio sp.]|uniref:hypothetical protein n=1 Tax=Ferrovibrio sp. TaxID=1917215 RepID=UPI0035B4F7C7